MPQKQLSDYRRVLDVRQQLVGRDWSQDLNESELKIMFGTTPYYAFGDLSALRQNQIQFQGPENRSSRRQIGDALNKATTLSRFERPIIEGIVDQLLRVHFCKAALTTRLLVLARPDIFVVVNQKSFLGLHKRFGLFVSDNDFSARKYVDLLEEIQRQEWYRSPQPEDSSEREFWMARAALLDPFVYSHASS